MVSRQVQHRQNILDIGHVGTLDSEPGGRIQEGVQKGMLGSGLGRMQDVASALEVEDLRFKTKTLFFRTSCKQLASLNIFTGYIVSYLGKAT